LPKGEERIAQLERDVQLLKEESGVTAGSLNSWEKVFGYLDD